MVLTHHHLSLMHIPSLHLFKDIRTSHAHPEPPQHQALALHLHLLVSHRQIHLLPLLQQGTTIVQEVAMITLKFLASLFRQKGYQS